MRLKKVAAMAVVACLFFTGASQFVLAETSNANIEFTPDEGITKPVDPEQPGTENPDEGGTGSAGALTIDHISNFNFGEQTISGSGKTYNTTTNRPYLQVTDKRGTGDGWKVIAQASSFTDASDQESLKGAVLTLKNARVNAENVVNPPTANQTVELPADGETDTNVITAEVGTGKGTWVNRWYPNPVPAAGSEDVTLYVPGGEGSVGVHKAVVTWTLSNTP